MKIDRLTVQLGHPMKIKDGQMERFHTTQFIDRIEWYVEMPTVFQGFQRELDTFMKDRPIHVYQP